MIVAGILSPIERPLTWLLETFHTSFGLDWAWAVVAVTLVVRVLLVPISVKQIHSMQRLQRHAPQLKELQKKYKNDKQKLREEQMKFFQENQVNPAASCLPILLQIPIFFALYFVLRDFDEEIYPEYPESDLGWLGFVPDITANINDHWSGFVLLAVYVASQVSSAYFMSMTADRTQRILFLVLPFLLVPFIIDPPGSTVFPVGLLIYWVTTNLWTVGQGLATRKLIPRGPLPTSPKRSSRTPPRETAPPAPAPETAPAVAEPRATQPDGRPRRVKRKKKKRTRR